jgi:hypothetical protein
MKKPIVFIASPYTKGDPAINTNFQCKVFDKLLSSGKVLPIAPLWSHFQHTVLPRRYDDWVRYNQELLPLYDCCLRLGAECSEIGYSQYESKGADAEVAAFKRMGKPVFASIEELYAWVDSVSQ